jgi:hypothetical protein
MVTFLSRKSVPGDYWRGLDGSTVFKGREPSAHHVGHWLKIPPCPSCQGMGCDDCDDRGLSDAGGLADADIWRELISDYGDERARQELGLDTPCVGSGCS